MRKLILAGILMLSVTPAFGAHPTDGDGCPIHVSESSADNPNLTDPTNDWDGLVLGNGSALVPAGDIYREGTDVTSAWFERTADALTVNIQVAELNPLQPNTSFYFIWSYQGGDALRERRWASGKLKGYGEEYTYGYMAINPITGGTSFVTEGVTTGRLSPSTRSVQMDLPSSGTTLSGADASAWGAPEAGSTLSDVVAESRVLVGSQEPLPPNPSGFRHGFVYVADTTTNGALQCGGFVD